MAVSSQFFRSLASFHRAGVTWAEALGQAAAGKAPLKQATDEVRAGAPLSDALAQHVSPLDRALIRAGEASGSLESRLVQLADRKDEEARHRREEAAALVYPILLAHIVSLLIFVFGAIRGSTFRSLMMAGVLLAPLYIWLFLRARAKRSYDKGTTSVEAPTVWFGNRNLIETRDAMAYQAMGDLLQGGVPLEETLSLSARAGAGGRVASDLHTARRQLPTGRPLEESWHAVPTEHATSLTLGERAGDLPDVATRLALGLQERVRLRRSKVRQILPVVFILVVGGFVAYEVISFYGGIYQGLGKLGR